MESDLIIRLKALGIDPQQAMTETLIDFFERVVVLEEALCKLIREQEDIATYRKLLASLPPRKQLERYLS